MKIGRRSFLIKLSLGITGLIGLVALDSFWFEKYIIDWTEFDISEGRKIKIIQLTDIHLKDIKYFHQTIASKISIEKPDFIVFTGDTISRRNSLSILEKLLDLINPEILKIVILGNKEYEAHVNLEDFKKIFKKYNGHVLINENYVFDKNGRKLNIIGIDDFLHGNPDFEKAIKNINKSFDSIVLNHCPKYTDTIDLLNKEARLPIKIILSGHTHGGQITFFGKEIYKPLGSGKYLKGWYQNETTRMYVSRGIGTTILPIRFFARAEASIFYI